MFASIKIEDIGAKDRQKCQLWKGVINHNLPGVGDLLVGNIPRRAWIAKITELCTKYKYKREFMKPRVDYCKSNNNFSRGVYLHYLLPEGVYDVSAPISWKKNDRYYCVSTEGMIIRINENEVVKWLNDI